jgi:hypothetical protein
MISKEVKSEICKVIDKQVQEMLKEYQDNTKYSLLNDINRLEIAETDYNEIVQAIENHFSEKYTNDPIYKEWKFKIDDNMCLDITDVPLNHVYDHHKRGKLAVRDINEDLDKYKAKGYKGTINYEKCYEISTYDFVLSRRNDLKEVNYGQYQLIYQDKPAKKEDKKASKLLEYPIKSESPFFCNEEFFSKQDKANKGFLNESEKVAISSTMLLVPFSCKREYFYLTIDNLTKEISLDSVKTAFKHINRQSNLYYQVISAIPLDLRENYAEFEHHLLKDMRKATGTNKKLIKKFYKDKPERLLKSKYIFLVE